MELPPSRRGGFLPRLFLGAVLACVGCTAADGGGGGVSERIDLDAYSGFIRNWPPETEPLCEVLRSRADWDRVFQALPPMGRRTLGPAPPDSFWRTRAILLAAHVVDWDAHAADPFQIERVTQESGALLLSYRFEPVAARSYSVKRALAVAVVKPLPGVVRFQENGRVVRTVRTDEPAGER